MRSKVEKELELLMNEGIIEPVRFTDWAAPIVPVMIRDKETVRICKNYKLTVNIALKLEQYPIPQIENLFAALSGSQYFSTLDMSQAYQQIELDDKSKQYVVTNTHKGTTVFHSVYPRLLQFSKESGRASSRECQEW